MLGEGPVEVTSRCAGRALSDVSAYVHTTYKNQYIGLTGTSF